MDLYWSDGVDTVTESIQVIPNTSSGQCGVDRMEKKTSSPQIKGIGMHYAMWSHGSYVAGVTPPTSSYTLQRPRGMTPQYPVTNDPAFYTSRASAKLFKPEPEPPSESPPADPEMPCLPLSQRFLTAQESNAHKNCQYQASPKRFHESAGSYCCDDSHGAISHGIPHPPTRISHTCDHPQASATRNTEHTWDIYQDAIMRCILQDMQATCFQLRISLDPRQWTPEGVRLWITDRINAQGLSYVNLNAFAMSGQNLLTMTLDDFKWLAPECGEKLKGCLDIWTAAYQYNRSNILTTSGSLGLPLSRECVSSVPDNWCSVPNAPTPQLSPPEPPPRTGTAEPRTPTLRHAAYASSSASCIDGNGAEMTYGNSIDFDFVEPTGTEDCSNEKSSPDSLDSGLSVDDNQDHKRNAPIIPYVAPQSHYSQHVHLWEFIRQLLDNPQKHGDCIRWISERTGIFKIEKSNKLARLWGNRKNRPAMNYDKLSRSLRQYYKKGILQKTPRSQRLIYQFCHPYNL